MRGLLFRLSVAISALACLHATSKQAAYAQTPPSVGDPPPCPAITVDCPSDKVFPGAPLTFIANVSASDPNLQISLNWKISAGTITSGQGTSSITVDTTGLNFQPVTATVEVGGVEARCPNAASCSARVEGIIDFFPFDEYRRLSLSDEQARLDNFGIELQSHPDAKGYILAYGGRRSRAGEAASRLKRATDYLNKRWRGASARLVTVDGGHREEATTTLWILPAWATPPTASPTVDSSEVQITKPRPRAANRRRPRSRHER